MNPYAPAPSSNDTQYCACCEAPFGIDYDNCECEGEVENEKCEVHNDN